VHRLAKSAQPNLRLAAIWAYSSVKISFSQQHCYVLSRQEKQPRENLLNTMVVTYEERIT
jgi:hypothetical protein